MIKYDRQRGTNFFYQFIILATSNQAFANFNIYYFSILESYIHHYSKRILTFSIVSLLFLQSDEMIFLVLNAEWLSLESTHKS